MKNLRQAGAIQIVSCYELGHQPLAAASAVAFLDRAGYRPGTLDLAVESLERLFERTDLEVVRLVAISVPMHTALHIGVGAARRIRERLPSAHLCFYGLYAWLNADYLLDGLADSVIGGEFEEPLVGLAGALDAGRSVRDIPGLGLRNRPAEPHLKRLSFPAPSRSGLPALERYAHLEIGGARRRAAAVEASRGCLHLCRHCPVPAVYAGRFFVVPREVVLTDIRQLVGGGVRHVTFADPDFFNGPRHALELARSLHAEFPRLTFDVTTKVENILQQRAVWDELARCGCIFVVSAVESLSDEVLGYLDKGHTRDDVFEAGRILDAAGIALRPSLVPFTPWTTIDDYLELLDWIDRDGLVDHVDPIQLSIRLLVPPGSLLAGVEALRPHIRRLNRERFNHEWAHPDPSMDRLQSEVAQLVRDAVQASEHAALTYGRIREAALIAAGLPASAEQPTRFLPARAAAPPPRLTEPWFC